jgi:hypothetical protein
MLAATGHDLTLGRRYKEMHLPLDVEIYVLGVVGEDRCIVAPESGPKGQRFSHQRQFRRVARGGARRQGQMDAGSGLVCLVGAVWCFGSAGWLVWSGLHQAEPPREVLQGGSVW